MSVQNLRQLFLLDTNITPIQNSKMQPASSFTFNPVQLYSTCNWGDQQNKQLTIIKLALTAINKLFALQNHGSSKNFKNQPRPLVKPSSVNFFQIFEISLMRQSL
jgi:hypothetical protein